MRTRTRKKKKMRRIGSSERYPSRAWRRGILPLTLWMAVLLPAARAEKKKTIGPYALVAGTVFREPGFALAGAEVTVTPNPGEGQAQVKIKKMQAISDARGEFAFRVSPAPMRYTVRVTARGYQSAEKSVSIEGEERAEATFVLQQESK